MNCAMVHIASGLFILALTCAPLPVLSLAAPSMPDASGTYLASTVAGLAASTAVPLYVRRR